MRAVRGPVILIHSPHAGHGAALATAQAALERAGVEIAQTLAVSALDGQPPQGVVWAAAGYGAAVVAGGDGTVGTVASHVAGSAVPLGILPLGTANDVARSLGVPVDLDAACNIAAYGVPRAVEMGQALPIANEAPDANANAGGATYSTQGEADAYFLHTLTLGLNVEFARLATDAARRQRWGPLNYAAAAVEALTHMQPVPLTVRLEGVAAGGYGIRMATTQSGKDATALRVEPHDATRTVSGQVIQFTVIATPVFGGAANLRLPDVGMRDGLLDFVFVEALGPEHPRLLRERLEQWLRGEAAPARNDDASTAPHDNAPELLALDLPGVWRFQARSATLLQPAGVDVTLDGEIRARTPTVIRVAPEVLQVLLPEAQQAG